MTASLSLNNPTEARTLNSYNSVEVLADSDIVSNIERKTWVTLPKLYADKIKNFVKNSKVVEGNWAKFTEDFIVNQMKSNWWISKQNQLLFIWDAIYEQITKNNFYDWEDWDSNRLSEFENAMDLIENCWKKYKEWFTSYMKQRSAEADKRSAEADKRSAEADKRSAEADNENLRLDSLWIKHMIEFYNIYTRSPNTAKQDEINFMKKSTQEVIADCKKHGIDHRAILMKEVWDKKKVDEILKFYGVE